MKMILAPTAPARAAPAHPARQVLASAIADICRGSLAALAVGTASLCTVPTEAVAQSAAAAASARDFDIATSPLGDALTRLAQQAGIQLRAPASLTSGKTAPALAGRYTTDAALRQLLAGSGLIFAYDGANAVVVSAAPEGANVLGAVRVGGAATGATTAAAGWAAGPNGSTDASATEGQTSYAASAVSLGGGSAQSVKDLPQSVSVIGSKQIQEQALVTLTDVLRQAPGVSVQQAGSGEYDFYSRGFQITKVQVDGGAPLALGSYDLAGTSVRGDLAAVYDHVEVMRGGVSDTDGFSDPGGTVNLQRKRPLDHAQVVVDASYGSWADRRIALDATAPLAFDGKLRGRAVVAKSEKNYFYETANSGNSTLYGILEADIWPSTMLTFGGTYGRDKGTTDSLGLPLNSDGSLLDVPRSTSFIPTWALMDLKSTEIFAKLEHHFNPDWSATLDVTQKREVGAVMAASLVGTVYPDGSGVGAGSGQYSTDNKQLAVSALVKGKFELGGLAQKVSFGVSRSTVEIPDNVRRVAAGGAYWNLGEFNSETTIPNPADATVIFDYTTVSDEVDKTAFVKLNALLTPRLHATLGLAWLQSTFNQETLTVLNIVGSPPGYYSPQSIQYKYTHFAPSIIGLSFDLSDAYSVYASVSDAYNTNSQSYVYAGSRTDTSVVPTPGNSKLASPSPGTNYEAGIKYLSPNKSLSASAAIFFLKQEDVLTDDNDFYADQTTGFSCCFLQGGTKVSKGIELQVAGEVMRGLQITGGYTYDLVTVSEGVDRGGFKYTPKHVLTLWGAYKPQSEFWNKFRFNAGVNFQSELKSTGTLASEDGEQYIDVTVHRPSYFVFGAGIGYQLSKNWDINFVANNLFDKVYYEQVGVPTGNYYGAPRNMKLALRGKF